MSKGDLSKGKHCASAISNNKMEDHHAPKNSLGRPPLSPVPSPPRVGFTPPSSPIISHGQKDLVEAISSSPNLQSRSWPILLDPPLSPIIALAPKETDFLPTNQPELLTGASIASNSVDLQSYQPDSSMQDVHLPIIR